MFGSRHSSISREGNKSLSWLIEDTFYMSFLHLPVQETVALPVNPGLHLQTKCPGRLQHSALSAHKAASEGTSHSLMSAGGKR